MAQRRWNRLLCLLAAWTLATGGHAATMKEASARFDDGNVAPVLGRIAKLIDSGFGEAECHAIANVVMSLKVDDEFSRAFVVKYGGEHVEFDVHVVMGPHFSPKLEISTSPDLAGLVQNQMNIFLDERR